MRYCLGLLLVLSLLGPSETQAQTVSCAPVGYWRFNEGTGTTVNDASPGLHHGSLLGTAGPNWDVGKIGTGSLLFDGQSANAHRVSVPHHADYNITGALTLAAWVNRTLLNTLDAIITKTNGSTQYDWQLYLSAVPANANRITFYADGLTVTGTSSTNLSTGVWQHVGVVRNGTSVAFYLNGAADGTGTIGSGAFQARTIGVLIGADGLANDYMHGLIDDPRIYPCALTAGDMTTLFNFTETAAPGAPAQRRRIISARPRLWSWLLASLEKTGYGWLAD